MYTLLRVLSPKVIFSEQLPALAGAWVAVEFYFRFNSFTLEVAVFLATWFALDGLLQLSKHLLGRKRQAMIFSGRRRSMSRARVF